MKTTRTILREALSEKLVPELKAQGFIGPEKIQGNGLFHEYKRKSDEETQHLAIQMEKRAKPRFVINISIEPKQGYDHMYKNGGTFLAARVQQSGGGSTLSWFRADYTIWEKIKRASHNKAILAIDSCLAILPEIDEWWSTQKSTTHVKDRSWVLPVEKT